VKRRTEDQVRESYADLLGDQEDTAAIRLIVDLDTGLTGSDPPPELWSRVPSRPVSPHDDSQTSHGGGPARLRHLRPVRFKRVRLVLAGSLLSLLAVGIGLAVSNITNLGKPIDVQSTNQYFPLDDFHRIGQSPTQRGQAELLFIGTLATADSKSATERWPVVKALEQFGTITNVRAIDRSCNAHQIGPGGCSVPTFDWSHAHYRSRYLTFAHADLLNAAGHALQRMSGQELQLYNRYARIPHSPFKHDPYDAFNTVLKSSLSANTTRGMPLVAVGQYLQTQSQLVTAGDFEVFSTPQPATPQAYIPPSVLPFATVRDSLLHASDPAQSHLVENVNAEANIITALICNADGKKPASVCNRPVIKSILKHVK
jgi:hypothetical protein